jgi:hypothetical protein
MNFLHDFMFTYRSFTKDGLELLEGLKARVACATEAEESRLIKLKYVPLTFFAHDQGFSMF